MTEMQKTFEDKCGSGGPSLSVVVVAMDGLESVPHMLEHLEKQTVAEEIEIVLVTAEDALSPPKKSTPLFGITVLRMGSCVSLGKAKAEGLKHAGAPVVVFLEGHVFPAPDFAEAIVRAHRIEKCAAVGPVMRNANPASKISCAQFLSFFYPWIEPAGRRKMDQLTWNCSSYKKALLMEFGSRLPHLIRAENLLQEELRRKGYYILMEPEAVSYHLNFSRATPWLLETFNVGRVFALHRSRKWSASRKVVYCLGSSIIPVVKLVRILRCVRNARLNQERLWKIVPFMMLGLLANAAGEMLSYAWGKGFKDYYFSLSDYHEQNSVEIAFDDRRG